MRPLHNATRVDPPQCVDETSERLAERARAFAALADNAPDAIARMTRRGAFLYVNRVVGSLFGREGPIGSSIVELGLPRAVASRYLRGVRRTFARATEESFEFTIEAPGAAKHFAVRIVPEFDERRAVESALAITYDVTQRTEVARQRDTLFEQERAARAKAEAASHARDQFLAIVSHELRSPLNGIQSWSHVLENQLSGPDRANPVAMRALEGIRAGIDQQVRLIEHLLDATVAMTGDLRLARTSLALRPLLESVIADIGPSAVAKNVALYVDLQLADQRIDGDGHRVGQIFGHLLSNALKFTPAGGSVWLSATGEGSEAVVAVRDSGRGLTSGFEHWLFEPFRQADSSNTRRVGGMGLGLALARRLAEVHGGRLTAESAGPHLGSTFTVVLPLDALERASPVSPLRTAAAHDSVPLTGVAALVIDDQLEAREALSALLLQFGASVTVAASSRAAIDLIERMFELPDIVVCDIAMPEEDGYGFVRRLREFEARAGRAAAERGESRSATSTPVIALSAFADTDGRHASDVDFDVHLSKPVNPQQLLSALSLLALGSRV